MAGRRKLSINVKHAKATPEGQKCQLKHGRETQAIYLSVCLSVRLSIYLSIYVSIYLSLSLSLYPFSWDQNAYRFLSQNEKTPASAASLYCVHLLWQVSRCQIPTSLSQRFHGNGQCLILSTAAQIVTSAYMHQRHQQENTHSQQCNMSATSCHTT